MQAKVEGHMDNQFLYARHLTDVLWYGAVRPYLASSTILVGRV